jgi:hypothetical protein
VLIADSRLPVFGGGVCSPFVRTEVPPTGLFPSMPDLYFDVFRAAILPLMGPPAMAMSALILSPKTRKIKFLVLRRLVSWPSARKRLLLKF